MRHRMLSRFACCAFIVVTTLWSPPERAARAGKPPNPPSPKWPIPPDPKAVEQAAKALRWQAVEEIIKPRTDGAHGFYLKNVNGLVLLAKDEDSIFYPSSTFKVLVHAYSLNQVDHGKIALTDPIAGGTQPLLQGVLTKMMQNSSNPDADALIDHWGMSQLNSYAASLGISNRTAFRHKLNTFNCGQDYAVSNTLTLADAGKLYEAVWQGKVVTGQTYGDFFNIMIHEPNSLWLVDPVLDQEAATAAIANDRKNAFRAQIKLAWKSGTSMGPTGKICESVAGVILLPVNRAKGATVPPLVAVFGYFSERATFVTQTNPTNLSALVVGEMLRQEIAPRMQTY